MRELKIGDHVICDHSFPYIIAEVGVNHEGSFKKAKSMVRLAKDGGANAVKFQSYKAEKLASKNSPYYWDLKKEPTKSQYQLFKKYDSFDSEEYIRLAEYCDKVGIAFCSTPFDDEAIDYLEPIVPFFKISSSDITNIPFLRKIASKGKPVILSTGASDISEIDLAVETIQKAGCKEIGLLHCILNYPTKAENAHLNMIMDLKNRYPEFIIGYSDHTTPDNAMTVLTTAYLKGARILEKHFTFDKTLPGNDHYHSMDTEDLKTLIDQLKLIRLIEGDSHKKSVVIEELSRKNARRSIVLKYDVKAGTIMKEDLITYKRPGTGISPVYWDKVIGLKVIKPLASDHILQWDDLTYPESHKQNIDRPT
jgi:N-acetylneuraminate synthase